MATPKLIVLGGINGQLEPAFQKLATLHAKNSFTLAILAGDVFTPTQDGAPIDALLGGSIDVPLPTYFTTGTHPLPPRIAAKVEADEEICHNLHFLGKRSITKTSDGIRIVALGGRRDPSTDGSGSGGQHAPFHTPADAKSLRGANSADILLTATWPAGVWNGSKAALEPVQQAAVESTDEIAELCAALKPRYHFAASPHDFFYEREPMVHPSENTSDVPQVTRFISMAPWGNKAKAKAMYAFSLNKSDTSIPTGATSSPFNRSRKRTAETDSYSRFGNYDDARHGRGRHSKKRRHSPPPGPDRCYFCLSNPTISAHMCCSIGEDAYLTTAKGPLPTATTFADQGLNFPGHFIITPLPHSPSIASMGSVTDPASEAVRTYAEMNRFREALQATLSARSSSKLGAVTWEISRERNVHVIWQLMAFPARDIREGLVETGFRVEAENMQYPAFVTRDLSLEDQATYGDFFRVWLWADDGEDKIKGKSLVMPLPPEMRFDLQFARRVLAKLLRLEKRIVWQDCAQTEDEEVKDVEAFKDAFQEWDFTLEDDS